MLASSVQREELDQPRAGHDLAQGNHLPRTRAERRRDSRLPMLVTGVLDVVVLALSAVLAFHLRSILPALDGMANAAVILPWVFSGISVAWIGWLIALGTYRPRNQGSGALEYQRTLIASVATAAMMGIVFYLTRYQFSRASFLLFFGIGTVLLLVGRLIVRRIFHRLHARGRLCTNVLLAGSPERIDELNRVLSREAWLGYEVVGGLTPDIPQHSRTDAGVPLVGRTAEVLAATEANDADAVIFADGAFMSSAEFRRMAWDLEGKHVQMIVVPGVTDVSAQRVQVRPVAGLPLVHIERPQHQTNALVFKRIFDVVVASLLIALFAIPMAIAASLIWLNDRGPVLFRQTRVGQHGKHFSCLKFRSMVTNAESLKDALSSDTDDGVLFKMADDPRITRVGKVLRRFSIDELPQLFNVVRGDMSLVGPRPPLPAEVAAYGDDVHRRLAARPGMTGLWQVSGRSNLSWQETVRLDIYYVDNWSMTQDMMILIRTAKAVLSSDGAY